AGNHGITQQGVSAYPASVTAQMVANFKSGGAAICQLCDAYGAAFDVIALDLDRPTEDFTAKPAMEVEDCVAALDAGADAVHENTDLLLLGEMGIGNTTTAAALTAALLGGEPQAWAGPGTGVDKAGVALKARVISDALACHQEHCGHAFEALRRLGGRELAAIAGAILEARARRVPVILDGYVCCAAALVLERARAGTLDHCLIGHVSSEPGHAKLLSQLGKEALLDLDMRLGEGTGAAMALGVLRGAVATHNGMATFAEAGVDDRD
ncbi:MAG: nicotinate-nucleotide--dimethylbenzimidazole phosphoribosyltransferase, partial [Hyphomicrobiales bacterium]|nr:nicotinate-nucleotide--dimethylbenzimidazole phosphoribosyltransferase [Hyphomicrobiales bacterium]